jgi:hypothetical protein
MDQYIPFVLLPIIGWGVWRYLNKKNDLTPLKRRTFFLAMISFSITEMGRSFYRPFIYQNNINDFFVADTIGNSFGTLTAIFMVITLSGRGTTRDWKIIVITICGILGCELLNLFGNRSFDVSDFLATMIFGLFSIIIYSHLLQKYGHQEAHKTDNTVSS